MNLKKKKNSEKAATMVEAAISIGLFLALISGVIDLMRLGFTQSAIRNLSEYSMNVITKNTRSARSNPSGLNGILTEHAAKLGLKTGSDNLIISFSPVISADDPSTNLYTESTDCRPDPSFPSNTGNDDDLIFTCINYKFEFLPIINIAFDIDLNINIVSKSIGRNENIAG